MNEGNLSIHIIDVAGRWVLAAMLSFRGGDWGWVLGWECRRCKTLCSWRGRTVLDSQRLLLVSMK